MSVEPEVSGQLANDNIWTHKMEAMSSDFAKLFAKHLARTITKMSNQDKKKRKAKRKQAEASRKRNRRN